MSNGKLAILTHDISSGSFKNPRNRSEDFQALNISKKYLYFFNSITLQQR